ncbi:hypothetical protein GCM10027174_09700 [Salinifilum aidingensis]
MKVNSLSRVPFGTALPPECSGTVTEHVDGTEGPCSRGTTCTGGYHARAEECVFAPEQCRYCLALRCEHNVIEHRTGAEECLGHGAACPPGAWHSGVHVDCLDVCGTEHVCPPRRALPGKAGLN